MSTAKRTFHSVLWNHAGKMLEYLLMYLTSIVIARGLGVAENGRFVGLFSLSQLLLVLCSFGLETSLNKFIPQLTDEKHTARAAYVLRKALLVRVVSFFAVAALFSLVAQSFVIPFFSQSGQALLYVLVFTGIRSIFPLFVAVLTAQLRTALTSRINLVVRTFEIVGALMLARWSMTVESLFILFASTSVLHVAAYAILCRTNLLVHGEPVAMKPILTFGSIFWVNTIVDFVLGRQGDVLFLSNLLPDSSQAGLYDVAYSIAQLATLAMTVGLTGVSFATFAKLAVTNQETMDRFYAFSIRMISLLTIPSYAFLIFNARAVLSVLYSPHYLAAAPLVEGILAFRIMSRLFGGPENGEYLLSQGRVVTLTTLGILAAFVNMLLNITLIPGFGATGSVIASGAGNLVVNFLGALVVFRISVNRLQPVFWTKLTFVALTSSFFCSQLFSAANFGSLIASGLLYLIILGSTFTVIKPFTNGDYQWLSRIDERLTHGLRRFTQTRLEPTR